MGCDLFESCNSCCSLRTIGFAIGWLGVVYRSVAIVALSWLFAIISDGDGISSDHLFEVFVICILSYTVASLALNLLLIVGISKKNPCLVLPYVGLEVLELVIMCLIGIIGGSTFLHFYEKPSLLPYFIPGMLIIFVIYFGLWFCLFKLLTEFEKISEEKNSEKASGNRKVSNIFKIFSRSTSDTFAVSA